jgi:hypothetical protein
MGISKLIKKFTPIILGGLFIIKLLNSCSLTNNTNITISKSDSIADFNLLLDNSDIEIDGAHAIKFNGNIHYLAYLKNRDTISLYDVTKGNVVNNIGLTEDAVAICSKNNMIYVFFEYQNYYSLITINDSISINPNIILEKISPIFSPDFFVSTNNTSNIHIIDSNQFLIPYKIEGGFKNMLDTFAYIYCNTKFADSSYRLVKFEHPEKYDYLYRPVTEFDFESNNFIYGFQKSNIINIVNFTTKKSTQIELDKFTSIEFPKDKIRNITYIRQYLKQNDRLDKILSVQNNDLFMIVKLAESSNSKFRIYHWNNEQKLLDNTDINYTIYTSLAFVKNQKLYVPNENNSYTVFTYNNS